MAHTCETKYVCTVARFIIYVEVKFNGPRRAMKFFSQLPSSRSIAAATFDTRVSCATARPKYSHFLVNDISRVLKYEDITKQIKHTKTRLENLAMEFIFRHLTKWKTLFRTIVRPKNKYLLTRNYILN